MKMYLIEPCCSQKHLRQLRDELGKDGTAFFHGYGDLSMVELLPSLLTHYSEIDLMIVAPYLPDAVAEVITKWVKKQWARIDGSGNLNVIAHLTIVADLSERQSPMASEWVKENPYPERMTLKNVQQNDTAILLPDIALMGPMNLNYGGHFTALATKNARTIETLRGMYEGLR
jgi:hypothetical protein